MKRSQAPALDTLHIEGEAFSGARVADGFYTALSSLKIPSDPALQPTEAAKEIFSNIVKLCKAGAEIPPVSQDQAKNISKRLKPTVRDIYGNSPHHYIQAGDDGVTHYTFLLNLIIKDISLASLEELNSTWSYICFKGGAKQRDQASS